MLLLPSAMELCMSSQALLPLLLLASLLLLLEPVLNAICAWLVLGELPAPWSLAGCAVIFGATVALTLRRRA